MPSPALHSAIGVAAVQFAPRERRTWRLYLLAVAASNLPDLDILPGIVAGELLKFHHFFSHSPAFAIGSALIFAAIASRAAGQEFKTCLPMFLFVCLSHPALDLITYDRFGITGGQPYGLPLAWPLTGHRWGPFAEIFPGLLASNHLKDWLVGENFKIVARELALGAALVLGARIAHQQAGEPEYSLESQDA